MSAVRVQVNIAQKQSMVAKQSGVVDSIGCFIDQYDERINNFSAAEYLCRLHTAPDFCMSLSNTSPAGGSIIALIGSAMLTDKSGLVPSAYLATLT